jgi:hypothetical protein
MGKSKTEILVCSVCGSTDIEELQWRKVNTGEYVSTSNSNDVEDQWCCNCESHVTFITKEEFEQQHRT